MKRTMHILALWALLSQWSDAQTIIQHTGSNNPTTEGFSTGGSESVFGTNDGGTLAWAIQDTGASSRIYYKTFSNADRVLLEPYWNVVWTLKIIDGPDTVADPFNTSIKLDYNVTNGTGNLRHYRLVFGTNGLGDATVGLHFGGGSTAAFVAPGVGTGFHTWQLTRINPASDVAQLYVDGVFLTNYAGYNDSYIDLEWGDGSGPGTSHAEWAYLLVEVPEPSSLLLMVLVSAAAGLLRTRR